MTSDQEKMESRFGPAIFGLVEDSSIRHLWRLSFLANFMTVPIYAELGKKYKMTRAEVAILYCLYRGKELLAQDIVLATSQPKNTISRAVSILLKKELIRRRTNETDRRAKTLVLTEAGHDIIVEIMPFFRNRQYAMREALTEDEKETFDKLVNKILLSMPNWPKVIPE